MASGVCEVEVEVRCLERPVHSGQKGGPMPDAVQILCRLIARLADANDFPFRVMDLQSQPFRGAANQIVDAARARIAVRGERDPRRAGQRLIRHLTRDPPFRARVSARIVRRRAAHP
jgi:hypothetical protein